MKEETLSSVPSVKRNLRLLVKASRSLLSQPNSMPKSTSLVKHLSQSRIVTPNTNSSPLLISAWPQEDLRKIRSMQINHFIATTLEEEIPSSTTQKPSR